MLRRGVASSDQEPLRIAEARQYAVDGLLRVGQVPTEFGAAMYSVYSGTNGSFWPRVSRQLSGVAQIVHATPLGADPRFIRPGTEWKYRGQNGPSFCAAFNKPERVARARQLLQFRHQGSLSVTFNASDCRAALEGDACPYSTGGMRDLEAWGEVLPAKVMPLGQLLSRHGPLH